MKVSEVTVGKVAEYLRLEAGEYVEAQIEAIINAAKSYIRGYTGLSDTEIDKYEDLAIALLVLCQDMHDNRTMYVDKSNANRVVDTILNMHRVNLVAANGGDSNDQSGQV